MKHHKPHPIALLFPAMSSEEYSFLKEDIRLNGLKNPILLYQGKILDGWHRYQICLELKIKPRFVTLDNDADILAEAITQNLARRQLIPAQQYGVFLRIADKFPEVQARIDLAKQQAKQRQEAGRGRSVPQQRQRSSEIIGQMCAVSHATVERVDRLRRLSPEAFEEVMDGKTTFLHALNRAAAAARRKKQEALNGNGANSTVRLFCGDFRKVLTKESFPPFALGWADMPWDRASLKLWEDVGRLAAKLLRAGGVLLAYPSKVELSEVMNILGRHLRFHWMMSANHAEPTALPKLRLLSKWQPILVYVKGSFNPPMLVLDVPPIPKMKEKDRHRWQRPLEEFTYYTQQLSWPGEWILDFAGGSFASGRAAKNLGRNYIGIDIDLDAVAKGRQWLEE